jgi:tRNA nucleotidyltransferase (CCA-adding enzyme)
MPRVNLNALENDLLLRGVWEGLGTPECHVTGGYVRDRLLGRESVDLDLVLPGTLEESTGPARRLAARLDTNAHLLGRDDKRVWRIETPEIRIELWPRGSLDLASDIGRRDFSVNAVIWNLPDGPLDDRVGGIDDLEIGSIRAVSRENLEQDPVRLVRASRFLAQLEGFCIDEETALWIIDLAPMLSGAPRERLGQELLKLVASPWAAAGIQNLIDLDLFERSAPPASSSDTAWTLDNLEAVSRLSGSSSHPLAEANREAGASAQLAFLLRGWRCFEAGAVSEYAWPRTVRDNAASAAKLVGKATETVDESAADRRWFIHIAGSSFPAVIAFAAAVEPDRPWTRWWRMWRSKGTELVRPFPLITGEEVCSLLDLPPGPPLGRAIDALTEAQIRGQVRSARGAEKWLKDRAKRDA